MSDWGSYLYTNEHDFEKSRRDIVMNQHIKRMIRDFFATISFVLLLDMIRSLIDNSDKLYSLQPARDIWNIAILFLIVGYIRHKNINEIKLVGLFFVIYMMITIGSEMFDISWQIADSLAYSLIILCVGYLIYWCIEFVKPKFR